MEESWLQAELAYRVDLRMRDHRDEWLADDTVSRVTDRMAGAKYWSGESLIRLGRNEEAAAALTLALSLKPDYAIARKALDSLTSRSPRGR
jgi:hypothetical protein